MSEFEFCTKEHIAEYCKNEKEKIKKSISNALKKGHARPRFLIIQVGNNPASNKYVKNKIQDCNNVEIETSLMKFPDNITYKEMSEFISKEKKWYHSIIIQLPLPEHLSTRLNELMQFISPQQDIDGFKIDSIHKPATPMGIISYIEDNKGIEWFTGKNAVVIGRSDIVGKPIAKMLTDRNCTVTLCHSKTKDIKQFTKIADLIIVAVGKAKFINSSYISKDKDVVIFDVGINFDEETGKMCGDVDYDDVTNYINNCTPVPFGVGQLTKCQVVKNIWNAYKTQEMR